MDADKDRTPELPRLSSDIYRPADDPDFTRLVERVRVGQQDADRASPHVVVRIDPYGDLSAHGPYPDRLSALAAVAADRREWVDPSTAPTVHAVRCHPPRR